MDKYKTDTQPFYTEIAQLTSFSTTPSFFFFFFFLYTEQNNSCPTALSHQCVSLYSNPAFRNQEA